MNKRQYDPESLLTGREIAEGLDYDNSHRVFPTEAMHLMALRGEMSPADVALFAPRVPLEYLVEGEYFAELELAS